jgi:fructose-1,6-bisphosphatase/inositol monophosphatase family enzyme
MNPEKTREILEMALKKGGQVLMGYHGRSLETSVKESIRSVVTDADLASERAIFEVLSSLRPPFNIISEEAGYMDNGSGYTWVVDPLDGTSNFAAGLPWFGVIIALFEGNLPVLGGMYLPLEGRLYMAAAGEGAMMDNKPLAACPRKDPFRDGSAGEALQRGQEHTLHQLPDGFLLHGRWQAGSRHQPDHKGLGYRRSLAHGAGGGRDCNRY